MTLIKKISQLHKAANPATLLSMALVMGAVSCDCGKDDKEGGEEKLDVALKFTKNADVINTTTEATVKGEGEVKEGTVDPEKITVTMKDLKATKAAGGDSGAKLSFVDEGKKLKDLGVSKTEKGNKFTFDVKIKTDKTSFAAGSGNDVASAKGELILKATLKDKDGKDTTKEFKGTVEFATKNP